MHQKREEDFSLIKLRLLENSASSSQNRWEYAQKIYHQCMEQWVKKQ